MTTGKEGFKGRTVNIRMSLQDCSRFPNILVADFEHKVFSKSSLTLRNILVSFIFHGDCKVAAIRGEGHCRKVQGFDKISRTRDFLFFNEESGNITYQGQCSGCFGEVWGIITLK